MAVYCFSPLQDPRWAALVESHRLASVFHTTGWLRALQRTYGYAPVAFTTSPPDSELRDGIVFCEVNSWLTGRRLVSLPFSDHCDPLVDDSSQFAELSAHLAAQRSNASWSYIEMRPRNSEAYGPFAKSKEFWLHVLHLGGNSDDLRRRFHRSSTQRKIARAEREGLVYEEGSSESLLREFYQLLALTRDRHGMPPQPFAWFCNLAECLGSSMKVRIARSGAQPIAGIITLRHRGTMTYKYGASDARFHRLGAVHLLFWRAIRDAVGEGCSSLDLGRTDLENTGLLVFKDRWGAARVPLWYVRNPARTVPGGRLRQWAMRCAKKGLLRAPAQLRAAVGRFLYRHAA